MNFIPQHLKTDNYSYYSQKSVVDLKSDLQTLFDNKWNNFSVNLTGNFTSDNEFQITKKISFVFSKSGACTSSKLKCKIYANGEKTIIDISIKPNPQLYFWTIIPLMVVILMLYSTLFHSTDDLSFEIIIGALFFLLIPIFARFYWQSKKMNLKNTFVEAFKLTQMN
jgi:hypothetical protein